MLSPYDQPPKEDVLEVKEDKSPLGVPQDGELEKLHLGRALGLEDLQDLKKYDEQLSRLVDWAKQKGAKSREDIVWQVRQLRDVVGGPNIGNNYVQHLSQYAYLQMERMKLDKQLKEMENG